MGASHVEPLPETCQGKPPNTTTASTYREAAERRHRDQLRSAHLVVQLAARKADVPCAHQPPVARHLQGERAEVGGGHAEAGEHHHHAAWDWRAIHRWRGLDLVRDGQGLQALAR